VEQLTGEDIFLQSAKNANVYLDYSDNGIHYQLKRDGVDVGAPQTGVGDQLTGEYLKLAHTQS